MTSFGRLLSEAAVLDRFGVRLERQALVIPG